MPTGWSELADWHFADSALHQWDIEEVKSLDASRSRVDRLPAGFTVDDDLTIDRCPLRRLPAGMSIGGRLSARYCWFESIPSDLRADVLDLRYSVVDTWPESLPTCARLYANGFSLFRLRLSLFARAWSSKLDVVDASRISPYRVITGKASTVAPSSGNNWSLSTLTLGEVASGRI